MLFYLSQAKEQVTRLVFRGSLLFNCMGFYLFQAKDQVKDPEWYLWVICRVNCSGFYLFRAEDQEWYLLWIGNYFVMKFRSSSNPESASLDGEEEEEEVEEE